MKPSDDDRNPRETYYAVNAPLRGGGEFSKQRGYGAEKMVADSLSGLKEKGWILDFEWVEQHSHFDHLGIDFFIRTIEGFRIPLQVKASKKLAQQFKKKNGHKIPVIVPYVSKDLDWELLQITHKYRPYYRDGYAERMGYMT